MKPQKIYIVEFYPQGSDLLESVQTVRPTQCICREASRYKNGIRSTSVRPLMLHGKQVYSLNGKRVTI